MAAATRTRSTSREGRGAAAQKGAAFGMAAEGEDEFYLRY